MPVRQFGTPISKLLDGLEQLKNGKARAVLLKNLAVESRTQVMDSFRESRDPYGNTWKSVGRGGQALIKTGRLRASIRGEALSHSFRVSTNAIYAAIHNYGGVIRAKSGEYLRFKWGRGKNDWATVREVTIPKRQFIPEGKLGPYWTKAFVDVTHRVMDMCLDPKGPHGVR